MRSKKAENQGKNYINKKIERMVMETIIIKFNKIEVANADLRKNILELTFFYEENGKQMKLQKKYCMADNIDQFVSSTIAEAKAKCMKGNAMPVDDLDFLNHYTNVLVHESTDVPTAEKMANAMRRFKDKVRNMKTLDRQESYIQKYNELIGLKAEIK